MDLFVSHLPVVLFATTALPQPPENLFLLEVTFSSVKLAWNSTGSRLMPPVKSYVVQYQPNGSSDNNVEMTVSKPEVFVDGLRAHTSYEFSVFAVSKVGRSLSAASIVVTTSRLSQTGKTSISVTVHCVVFYKMLDSFILFRNYYQGFHAS